MSRKFSSHFAHLSACLLATSLTLVIPGSAAHAQFMGGEMTRPSGGMGGGHMSEGMHSGGGGAAIGFGVGLAIGMTTAAIQQQEDSKGRSTKKQSTDAGLALSTTDDNRISGTKQPKRLAKRGGNDNNGQDAGKKPKNDGKEEKQTRTDDHPQTPEGPPNGNTPKTPEGGKKGDGQGTSDKPAAQAGDPPATTGKRHLSIIHEDKPGTEDASNKIDCGDHAGRVTVRTGVDIHWNSIAEHGKEKQQGNMIAIKYEGTNCDDCMWVQFVWSEALIKKGDEVTRKPLKYEASTGKVLDTTMDPTKPNWMLDSGQPFGLAYSGTSNVDASSDVIYDKTGWPFDGWLDPQTNEYYGFDQEKGEKEITLEWRDHFETFLMCKGKVCAKVSWNTTWIRSWEHPDDDGNGPKYSGIEISTKASLSDGQQKAIADKFLQDAQKITSNAAASAASTDQPKQADAGPK